ncbi:MAG: linear amide hydrolase [Proteobacteria bacterium]|nr:linear amide hydrolase [Pseudomonadota bacterium]
MSTATSPLACSAFWFTADRTTLLARNLDTPFADGYLFACPRGREKRSLLPNALRPAHWINRYGALTFNTIGRGLPMGGINETGFVVEHLHMPGSVYPAARGRPQLLEFEWIQYLLDNCNGVAEALLAMDQVAIAAHRIGMHFLLADAAGLCALVEFRAGSRQVYTQRFLERPLITNDWYEDSLAHLGGHAGFGGSAPVRMASRESLDRFAIVAALCRDLSPGLEKDATHLEAMRILDAVQNNTVLSVVYEPAAKTLAYKTQRNQQVRRLSLAEFDFAANAGEVMIDMHASAEARPPYDEVLNIASMRKAVSAHDEFLQLGPLLFPTRCTDSIAAGATEASARSAAAAIPD